MKVLIWRRRRVPRTATIWSLTDGHTVLAAIEGKTGLEFKRAKRTIEATYARREPTVFEVRV